MLIKVSFTMSALTCYQRTYCLTEDNLAHTVGSLKVKDDYGELIIEA